VRTVLLIDDNPLSRRLVRAALQPDVAIVIEAPDARSALALLDGNPPDLVLLDLVQPDLSGVELLQRMRAHPATAGVPVLAFTGLLSKDDEARATAAGFDGFVVKPIEPTLLRRLVHGHLPAETMRVPPFGEGKTVLVVDDDPLQLKLARFRFGKLGFTVEIASDGIEALATMRRVRPDVIVTDVLMPRLDGFGLCLAVRENPELGDVPIVLVTSSYVERADRELARQVGANAFVLRTADLMGVIVALEEILVAEPIRPPHVAGPDPAGDTETARAQRVLHQLERQVAVNAGLMQRCTTLAAERSILATITDTLIETRDLAGALFDILANCLDVAGASRGAIFVREPDGRVVVRAAHGFDRDRDLLAWLLDHPEWLEPSGATPVEAASGELATVLLVPLIAHGEHLGTLLLDAPASGTSSADWHAFGQAIGAQVSLGLALARSFSRIEASEKRARALMEGAEDAIFVGDDQGIIQEINRAAERLLAGGHGEIVGRHFREIVADPQRALVDQGLESLRGGRPVSRTDGHAVRAGGARVPIEYSLTMVGTGRERRFVAIARDVSERNALAEQLRQSQKMEAIGRLAGGVAHDFNNMLSIVLSYSELLLREVPSGDPMAADLLEIKQAGERASELTSQLLALGRKQVVGARVVAVNDVVASAERMLRRLIGEDIELAVALAPDLAPIRADSGQLHQVLLNLAINARDAMPRGGKLSIETRNADVAAPDETRRGLRPGRYVVLSVVDDGSGMDEATVARIFEPFFTTKEAGKGTGLGLSTVFGIVEQAGGAVCVESEPGKGSRFDVYFPTTDAAVVEGPAPGAAALTGRGHETILLVEDEDQVRRLITGILQRGGYRVLEASSAGEAVLICEQHPAAIDLLLSDVVMPRLSGHDLARRLCALRPEMRVLLMSGYSEHAARAPIDFPLLAKPIRPDLLAVKLREVLAAPLAG